MTEIKTFRWKHFAASFLLLCIISAVINYYFVDFSFSQDTNPYLKMIKGMGFYTVLFSIYYVPFGIASLLLAFFTRRKHLLPLYLTYALLPAILVSMFFTYQMWKYHDVFGSAL